MSTVQKHETIIVGGGIAGLACAKTLSDNGREFLLLSENIGGRMKTSADGRVHYGALWVSSFYRNLSAFVQRTKVVPKAEIYMYEEGNATSALLRAFRRPVQGLVCSFLTLRFFIAYARMQRNSESMSQKRAIESDPYLHDLYRTPAVEYTRKHKIADYAEYVVSPALRGVLCSTLAEQNAFNFLLVSLGTIFPFYEFSFDIDTFTRGFQTSITTGTVTKIEESGGVFTVSTNDNRSFETRNVVIATPSHITNELLKRSNSGHGRKAFVLHIEGTLRDTYRWGRLKFFDRGDVLGIFENSDGTYLLYSTSASVDVVRFFSAAKVIATTIWDPVYPAPSTRLADSNPQERMWVIGDHNIVGLEDAYTTGLYAANSILKN